MLDFAINNDPAQAIATINETIYYLYDGETYSFNLSDNKNIWVSHPMGHNSSIFDEIDTDDKYDNTTYIKINIDMIDNFLELLAMEYQSLEFSIEWEKVKTIIKGIFDLYDLDDSESRFIETLKTIEAFNDFKEITGYKE